MRINMEISDLEAFLAVKQSGSFHQAAIELGLSQSAVTRRIQKLETALDSVLFERTTRAVKPTLAAKRLEARAEAILADMRETTLAMRDESVAFAHQRNAIVTLAIVPTLVAKLLPDAIRRFHADGHSARIRLLDLSANEVTESVKEGEADFGICSLPSLEPNISFSALFEDSISLALPRGHSLLARAEIRWKDLADEELILPNRQMGNRLLIDDAFAAQNVSLRWTYEVGRTSTALDLVAGGCGIALVPQATVEHDKRRDLDIRPLIEPVISRPVGLITRQGQKDTEAALALQKAIRSVAAGPQAHRD